MRRGARRVTGVVGATSAAFVVLAGSARVSRGSPPAGADASLSDGGAACTITASGARKVRSACTVARLPDVYYLDAAAESFVIVESPQAGDGGRSMRFGLRHATAVTQALARRYPGPPGSIPPQLPDWQAAAVYQEADYAWEASGGNVSITMFRAVAGAGPDGGVGYEIHGTVDATLLPTLDSRATGVLDLTAAF